jgi:hypothetical protein
MCKVRLEFDGTPQLAELQDLLKLQRAPDEVLGELNRLSVDVIRGDSVTAAVAGEAVQITRLRFGISFESTIAAFRAGDFDSVAHILDGLRKLQPALSR